MDNLSDQQLVVDYLAGDEKTMLEYGMLWNQLLNIFGKEKWQAAQ